MMAMLDACLILSEHLICSFVCGHLITVCGLHVIGRRTQYNALKDRPAAWDPYGVARVNMSEFLLGQKIINLQIPVHNCAVPDVLGRNSDSGRLRLDIKLLTLKLIFDSFAKPAKQT